MREGLQTRRGEAWRGSPAHEIRPGPADGSPEAGIRPCSKAPPPGSEPRYVGNSLRSLAVPWQIRVKCNEDDLVGDLKKLVAAQTGTRPESIRLQKWNQVFKVRWFAAVVYGLVCRSICRFVCQSPRAASLAPTHTLELVQDHITLADYEIHDGMSLELYYN